MADRATPSAIVGRAEGLSQRERDHRVADSALGELQCDGRGLDLDDGAQGHPRVLGPAEQLPPGGIHVAPTHLGRTRSQAASSAIVLGSRLGAITETEDRLHRVDHRTDVQPAASTGSATSPASSPARTLVATCTEFG